MQGGPIKEHLVDMAYQKRQSSRSDKGKAVLDKFEGKKKDCEEDQELDELDGNMLEAFNMRDEREHGFIDADGSFVERKNKDEEELKKDAWLSSIEVCASTQGYLLHQYKVSLSNACLSTHTDLSASQGSQ